LRSRIDVDGCDDPRDRARPARSVAPEAAKLAALYEQIGDLRSAARAYQLIIACAPGHAAYARLHALQRRLGNWSSAGEVLSKLLVLEPARAELLIARGQARLRVEQVGLAAHDFERALRLEPNSESAAEGLRLAYALLLPRDPNRPSAGLCP
jgi:tetratricopeptide (TPR) repeat protein